jgi:predicted ArsR family transcriptional regulator
LVIYGVPSQAFGANNPGRRAYRDLVADAQLAPDEATVRTVAALDDPSRLALYRYVRASAGPVTREQAATGVGLSLKVATFHLDRLVAAGLLVASVDPATRHRPLGRLPKVYRPADIELGLTIPDRRPLLLAELLLDAVCTAAPGESARDAALRAAGQKGRQIGAAARPRRGRARAKAADPLTAAGATLAAHGYEPARVSADAVRLRNCPFKPLAEQATDLVCAINHSLVEGLLAGIRAEGLQAQLDPGNASCCVVIRATGNDSRPSP